MASVSAEFRRCKGNCSNNVAAGAATLNKLI
jgi:hypothetical protein